MPFKSEDQRRMMYAKALQGGKGGPSKKVAKKFIKHDDGGKLPEKKSK